MLLRQRFLPGAHSEKWFCGLAFAQKILRRDGVEKIADIRGREDKTLGDIFVRPEISPKIMEDPSSALQVTDLVLQCLWISNDAQVDIVRGAEIHYYADESYRMTVPCSVDWKVLGTNHRGSMQDVLVHQARNQFGTPGGAKSFLRGAQISWIMSNNFKRCPTHSSRWSENCSKGGFALPAPLWLRAWCALTRSVKAASENNFYRSFKL